MYFITTKTTAHTDGSKIRVLGTTEKRDVARKLAAEKEGTVRTQAEIDALLTAGRLDKTTMPGYVPPEVIPADTAWTALAKQVAKVGRQNAQTIGKKEKTLKRPPTDENVILHATAYCRTLQAENKVSIVRKLALWTDADMGGAKLQRCDAFTIIHAVFPDVADHTISTQWQLVRSGKFVTK